VGVSALSALLERRAEQVASAGQRLHAARARRVERAADRTAALGARLAPALARLIADSARRSVDGRGRLAGLSARLDAAPAKRLSALVARLEALDRTRQTLGYAQTLARGYAVVRSDGVVMTTKDQAEKAGGLEIEFQDGRLMLGARPATRKGPGKPPGQGSLF